MSTMTAFTIGDRVWSRIDGQGLRQLVEYRVVQIDERCFPFGDVVTYYVVPVAEPDAKPIRVGNGHLVLEAV